jgi:hypothetical protein
MYHLSNLIGKIVTIKTIRGDELITMLSGINEEHTVLTLNNAKLVGISNNQVVLLPYLFTATTDSLYMEVKNCLIITETVHAAAEDYVQMIAEELETSQSV